MKNTPSENVYYRCSDFPLIVTLSLWFPIEGIDRTDSKRTCFLFPQSEELTNVVAAYSRLELKVSPLAFYQASKNIKTRLYDEA